MDLKLAAANVGLVGVPTTGFPAFYLDRILKRLGLELADFNQHEPQVWLAFGEDALRTLTGYSGVRRYRGYVLDGPKNVPTIATFHPLNVIPNKHTAHAADKNPWRLVAAVLMDVRKALNLATAPFKREEPIYLCDPAVAGFYEFYREYERAGFPVLSYDIETPGKLVEEDDTDNDEDIGSTVILRIGFSFAPGYAASVPWRGDYLPLIEQFLMSPGPKLGWNSYAFDNIVLGKNKMFPAGELHDGSWAWKILQSDLPRGLEFVGGFYATGLFPWKHLGESEPARYNAQDADVALRNYLGTIADLEALGQLELYQQHIVKLDPILREAGKRGVPIDPEAQASLRADLDVEEASLTTEIQSFIPHELFPRKRYKNRPTEERLAAMQALGVEEVTVEGLVKQCSMCGAVDVTKLEHLKGGKKNPCAGATFTKVLAPQTEFDVVLPFNPAGDDLERYVQHFKHPMGKHAKTGEPTLDKKHLEFLAKHYGKTHPIYAKTLSLRQVSKVKGTFLFPADREGRIHTEYTYGPSSGRLSSRRPNLQNVTHGSSNPYADRVRRTIVPPPGHLFVEADSSAIEAVFSGVFMGSPLYTDLARKGVHDYVTCLELGLPFDVSALGSYKKDPRYAEARERNKRVVHGTNYGMTPNLMIKLFPEQFPTLRVAKEAQQRYFDACPELQAWHHQVRTTAHRQGYLENPWKRRHYFWRVFGKDPHTGKVTVAEDGKRCVSFLPQSSAADFMLDHLLILGDSKFREFMPANVSVHDSLCLAVPEGLVDEAVQFLIEVMFRPIPQMNHIRVGVEVKVGPNWADMKVVQKVSPADALAA